MENLTSDFAVIETEPYFPGQPEPSSCHRNRMGQQNGNDARFTALMKAMAQPLPGEHLGSFDRTRFLGPILHSLPPNILIQLAWRAGLGAGIPLIVGTAVSHGVSPCCTAR